MEANGQRDECLRLEAFLMEIKAVSYMLELEREQLLKRPFRTAHCEANPRHKLIKHSLLKVICTRS